MAYYDPYITGLYNPLYKLNSQGFGYCSGVNLVGDIGTQLRQSDVVLLITSTSGIVSGHDFFRS